MKKTIVIGNLDQNNQFFGYSKLVRSIHDVDTCDLLVFWGGTDINPSFYGEKNYASSNSDHKRDFLESKIFDYAAQKGIPMLGICRGAQLLCAKLGGKLYQHVDGHGRDHEMILEVDAGEFKAGTRIFITSTHHQMMRPSADMILVGRSEFRTTVKTTEKGTETFNEQEIEILAQPDKKVLMIQGHPEYMKANAVFPRLTEALVQKYLGVTL